MNENELDFNLDIDGIVQNNELSEQEINDILGVEYVSQNNEVEEFLPEIEDEDPSIKRLKKIKENNKKKEKQKKEALLRAKQMANEQSKSSTVKPKIQNTYINNIARERKNVDYNIPLLQPTVFGGSMFSSNTMQYKENNIIQPEQYETEISSYRSQDNVEKSTYSSYFPNEENISIRYRDEKDSSSLNQRNSLPFQIDAMDMRKAYTLESSQSLQEIEERGTQTVFENTGNTPVIDTISRNIAGSITDSGVWVNCDIISSSEKLGEVAFNSRNETEVIQPIQRPAEDIGRLIKEVTNSSFEESSILSRRTSDYKEGVIIPENAQMREVLEQEIIENTPKVADTSILYATSSDMDNTVNRVVLQSQSEKPTILSGENEVQTVSSVKEASSLLNKTLEGLTISAQERINEEVRNNNSLNKSNIDTFAVDNSTDSTIINLQKGNSVEETFKETVNNMANTLKLATSSRDTNTDVVSGENHKEASKSADFLPINDKENTEKTSLKSVELSKDQVEALKDAMKLANIEDTIEDFAKKNGLTIKVVDTDFKLNYKVTNATGGSLEKRNTNISSKEAALIGDKVEDPAKRKESLVNEEVKEGETKDYRKIQDAAKRKFISENGQMWKDFCNTSEIIVGTTLNYLAPTEDAGFQAFQKSMRIASSVNHFLCYWGASASYNMIADRALDIADGANIVNKLCADANGLTLADLSLSKSELKEKLKASGISGKKIKSILNNSDEIKQMMETKQTLFDFAKSTGKLSVDSLNFLGSQEFFNSKLFSKDFNTLLSTYFLNSNDEMLRKLNPIGLSAKDIKKLLKQDKKNKANGLIGFSEKDTQILTFLSKHKSMINIMQKSAGSHGIKNKISSIFGMSKNLFLQIDDASINGIKSIFKMFNGIKTAKNMMLFGGSATLWTVKFAGKIVFLNPISKFTGRTIKKGLTIVKNTTKTAVKNSKAGKLASKTSRKVKDAVQKNEQVKKLKKVSEKVKKTKENINKKATQKNLKKAEKKSKKNSKKRAKASKSSKVNKVIRTPGRIIMKPFNAVAKLVNKATDFIKRRIMIPVIGIIGIILILYTILVVLSAVLMGLIETSQKQIFLEPANVQKLVSELNEKTNKVYASAKKTAKQSPVSNKVYNNTKLYAYGSPKFNDDPTSEYYHNRVPIDDELLNGWHIYYLDSQGNVLGSNVSNVKDILSVVCAMMNNSSDDVGEYRNLINDMWDGMVPVITARESDIYHTEYSTDTFPKDGSTYYCTDSDFYDKYNTTKDEGTCFYDIVAPSHLTDANDEGYICTGKGCMYKEWDEWVLTCTTTEHTHGTGCDKKNCSHKCSAPNCTQHSMYNDGCIDICEHPLTYVAYKFFKCDHKCDGNCCSKAEHTHSKDGGCYRHDLHRDYYCPGHNALHCSYGYRDINVYVTLILKDDIFKSPIDENGITITYKVPTNFNCTEFESKQATIKFQNHFDGYKGRMKCFLENGAWDYEQHSAHAVLNQETGYMECNVPRMDNGNYNTGADISERCAGNIEWCNNLYNEDWYELYGASVYNSDSGLSAGSSLTDEEKQSILNNLQKKYGTISEARNSFITFSLNQVGAIPYWFGGKPSSKEWNNKWGTLATSDDPYYNYNSEKGRNMLGLDCSGFVGWCYWNVFNKQPGCSTSNFTTSLGLPQTSFMNLQPGDIGLSNVPGSSSNHIGIFVGFDENGKALWVHCNGSTANVAVNNYNGFRYYYKLIP